MADIVGVKYSWLQLGPGRPISWTARGLRLTRAPEGFIGDDELQPITTGDIYSWGEVKGIGTTYGILGLNDSGNVKPFLFREFCRAADCPVFDPYILQCAGTYDRSRKVVLQMALTCQRTLTDGTPSGPGGTIDMILVGGVSAGGAFAMYGP